VDVRSGHRKEEATGRRGRTGVRHDGGSEIDVEGRTASLLEPPGAAFFAALFLRCRMSTFKHDFALATMTHKHSWRAHTLPTASMAPPILLSSPKSQQKRRADVLRTMQVRLHTVVVHGLLLGKEWGVHKVGTPDGHVDVGLPLDSIPAFGLGGRCKADGADAANTSRMQKQHHGPTLRVALTVSVESEGIARIRPIGKHPGMANHLHRRPIALQFTSFQVQALLQLPDQLLVDWRHYRSVLEVLHEATSTAVAVSSPVDWNLCGFVHKGGLVSAKARHEYFFLGGGGVRVGGEESGCEKNKRLKLPHAGRVTAGPSQTQFRPYANQIIRSAAHPNTRSPHLAQHNPSLPPSSPSQNYLRRWLGKAHTN